MASYKVVRVPLDAALDRQEIIPRGFPVRYVTVDSMTAGAVASIHFGSGDAITLEPGRMFDSCPAEMEGVAVSSAAAQVGAELVLILGTLNVSQGA